MADESLVRFHEPLNKRGEICDHTTPIYLSGTTCSMKPKVVAIIMFDHNNIGGIGQKECYNFFHRNYN